jgi:hypothetical protein
MTQQPIEELASQIQRELNDPKLRIGSCRRYAREIVEGPLRMEAVLRSFERIRRLQESGQLHGDPWCYFIATMDRELERARRSAH